MSKQEKGQFGGLKDVRKYQPTDIRFTTKNGNLYVFTLGIPIEDIAVKSLALSTSKSQKIQSIQLLGSKEKITWKQGNETLSIIKPNSFPSQNVVCFKVRFEK